MHSPRVLVVKVLPFRIANQRSVIFQAALRWSAVVSWIGVIFALSAIPSFATPLDPFYNFILKKLAHLTEYVILTALLFWALRLHITRRAQVVLMAALIAVLYAISDEWHQTFVPGREGSLRDVAIDALGVVGVSLCFARPE